jgi:hypothetical protein
MTEVVLDFGGHPKSETLADANQRRSGCALVRYLTIVLFNVG